MLDDMFEIGDNWLNRTIRLAYVWQDSNESGERREKAFTLWLVMSRRVMKLKELYQEVCKVSSPKLKFESGGVVFNEK